MPLNSQSHWDSDVVESFMEEETHKKRFAVQWVQHLVDSNEVTEAREWAQVTVSELLQHLHESRLEFEHLRVAAKEAEADFFGTAEDFAEYLKYRLYWVENKREADLKRIQDLQQVAPDLLVDELSDICITGLEEERSFIGEFNALHMRKKALRRLYTNK